MSRDVLAVDAAVAVTLALLVLILSPGIAVAAIVGLLVLLSCGASLVWQGRRLRRRPDRHPSQPPRSRRTQ
jgi:hypothetical protein